MAQDLGAFDRRTLAWLVGVGAGSLLLGVYMLLAVPPPPEAPSHEANAFSRSAIGHRAFIELLRSYRVPVVVSRHNSGARAAASGVLVILEPRLDRPGRSRRMEQMLEDARTALIVLPKWRGIEDPQRPGWLKRVGFLPAGEVSDVLEAAGIKAEVQRAARGAAPRACGAWTAEIHAPQLLRSSELKPVITCDGDILLGEVQRENRRVLVLADPDVLSNHGLPRAQNAALALDAVKRAGSPNRVLIVDETLHGFESVPSLWNELFRPPLVLAVIQATLALGVLMWSGLPRFGAPLPVRPALESGKGVLIDNTASLLRLGGFAPHVLERYLEITVNDALSALHTSRHEPRRERLARLNRQPGLTVDILRTEALVHRVRGGGAAAGDAVVLSLAQKVHRWKEEVIRGPQLRPRR